MTGRTVMDTIEYDKIVDKLVAFRAKIPQNHHLSSHMARNAARNLRVSIDNMLHDIDKYAELDILGWIK